MSFLLVFGSLACGDDDSTSDGADSSGAGSTAESSDSTADDDGASSTDASAGTSTGSASAETDGESSGDGTTSATTTADSSSDESGATTGGGGIEACSDADPVCSEGTCRPSGCCDGAGFCDTERLQSCGGFIGTPCPGGYVCVTDICIADGDGRCLDPETAAALDAAQPGCWNAG